MHKFPKFLYPQGHSKRARWHSHLQWLHYRQVCLIFVPEDIIMNIWESKQTFLLLGGGGRMETLSLAFMSVWKGILKQRKSVPLFKSHGEKCEKPVVSSHLTDSTLCWKVRSFLNYLEVCVPGIHQASLYVCITFWIAFFLLVYLTQSIMLS